MIIANIISYLFIWTVNDIFQNHYRLTQDWLKFAIFTRWSSEPNWKMIYFQLFFSFWIAFRVFSLQQIETIGSEARVELLKNDWKMKNISINGDSNAWNDFFIHEFIRYRELLNNVTQGFQIIVVTDGNGYWQLLIARTNFRSKFPIDKSRICPRKSWILNPVSSTCFWWHHKDYEHT